MQTALHQAKAGPRPFTSQQRPHFRRASVAASAARPQQHGEQHAPNHGGGRQQQWLSAAKQGAARLAAAALAAAIVAGGCAPPAPAVTTEQLLFLEAWRTIDKAYVDKSFNGQSWFRVKEDYLKKVPMTNRQQTHDAIRRLADSLGDPFTRWLEPERLAALRRGTAGSVTGVGVEVTFTDSKDGSELAVVTPAPGGPAEAAGVRAGDVIEAIGGTKSRGLSLYEVSDLLQGEEGSEVTLRVRSSGRAPRDVTVARRRVTIVPVASEICTGVNAASLPPGADAPGRVGYIRLATFNGNTATATQAAILDLKKQGIDAYVLDVRSNGGGSFPAGVAVARMWVDRGEIVLIADSAGVRDIYSADGNALDAATPMSVLVNKGTGSAAEVLAGALRDNKRATIVGSTTFGKGLIQTVADLSDGSGLAITLARYQTPLGIDINKVGISPDIAIEDGTEVGPEPGKLPPPTAGAVCRLLASDAAPRLFK
ncbi:MAG: photosystem II D1 protease [Monoraphidium minutum]|nr:MAG: photosystem II D1 protease [Monoraphidium minutum]